MIVSYQASVSYTSMIMRLHAISANFRRVYILNTNALYFGLHIPAYIDLFIPTQAYLYHPKIYSYPPIPLRNLQPNDFKNINYYLSLGH